MHATFLESWGITDWLAKNFPDEVLALLQQQLMDNPNAGDVIPGCGGIRKLRVSDPRRGKGKRSGIRIFYLYLPESKWFYLLDAYGKNEREDLSADQKKILARLADEFRAQAKLRQARQNQGRA